MKQYIAQATIPQEIMKVLNVNVGDAVYFVVNGNQIVLANSLRLVLLN